MTCCAYFCVFSFVSILFDVLWLFRLNGEEIVYFDGIVIAGLICLESLLICTFGFIDFVELLHFTWVNKIIIAHENAH